MQPTLNGSKILIIKYIIHNMYYMRSENHLIRPVLFMMSSVIWLSDESTIRNYRGRYLMLSIIYTFI